MRGLKKKVILSIIITLLMIMAPGATCWGALTHFVALDKNTNEYVEYDKTELNTSYLNFQRNRAGAELYNDFVSRTGGRTVALKDSINGYIDYADVSKAYLAAQRAGQTFEVDQYMESATAKVFTAITPGSVAAVSVNNGAVVVTPGSGTGTTQVSAVVAAYGTGSDTVTVTFNTDLSAQPATSDFSITRKVDGSADNSALTVAGINWSSSTPRVVTFTVTPQVVSDASEKLVKYSVAYKGAAAVEHTAGFTVPATGIPQVYSVCAVTNTQAEVLLNQDITSEQLSNMQFTISPNLSISNQAKHATKSRTIVLTTGSQTNGTAYTLYLNGQTTGQTFKGIAIGATAPSAPEVTLETSGEITGLTSGITYEYQIAGETTWQDYIPPLPATELAGKTILIRQKATATTPAGLPTEVYVQSNAIDPTAGTYITNVQFSKGNFMGATYFSILITTTSDVFTAKANSLNMTYKGNRQFLTQSDTFIENNPVTISVYDRNNQLLERNVYIIK